MEGAPLFSLLYNYERGFLYCQFVANLKFPCRMIFSQIGKDDIIFKLKSRLQSMMTHNDARRECFLYD